MKNKLVLNYCVLVACFFAILSFIAFAIGNFEALLYNLWGNIAFTAIAIYIYISDYGETKYYERE